MGASVYLIGAFHKESWSDSTIVDAHQAFEWVGFEPQPTRHSDAIKCERKDVSYDTAGTEQEPITAAVDDLADGQSIDIRYEAGPDWIEVTYRSGPEIGDLPMPVGMGGPDAYNFDPEAVGDETVTERIERFGDAFVEVANAIDPDVGYLKLRNEYAGMEGMPGGTDPSEHGPEKLPFLLVLSESWVEHCGGHDRVMNAPVYRTQALDTGGVVVQVTERPDLDGDYHDGAEYFFGD